MTLEPVELLKEGGTESKALHEQLLDVLNCYGERRHHVITVPPWLGGMNRCFNDDFTVLEQLQLDSRALVLIGLAGLSDNQTVAFDTSRFRVFVTEKTDLR